MNINRHNYEEFFLLYVDNELPATERKAVEVFVEENPDLQEELLMLQQSVVKPDKVSFTAKHILLKEEVEIDDLQEKLLLHLDNELDPAEKNTLESLIASDTAVKEEWAVLQQTKLQPDQSIVFAGRRSLYRKEAAKIIPFPWRRIAVAAILLGFGAWGVLSLLNSSRTNNNETTATNNTVGKQEKKIIMISPVENKQTSTSPGNVPIVVTTEKQEPGPGTPSGKKVKQLTVKEELLTNSSDNNAKKKSNNLPKPYFENINNNSSNNNGIENVPQEKQNNNLPDPVNNEGLVNNMPKEKLNNAINNNPDKAANQEANIYAKTAALKENVEENNDNRIFYIKEDKLKKTKLGSLFTKVKTVLDRRSKTSSGKTVQLANVEFALQ